MEDDEEEDDYSGVDSVNIPLSANFNKWSGDIMTDKIIIIWIKINKYILHEYSIAGLLLFPNPKLMKE